MASIAAGGLAKPIAFSGPRWSLVKLLIVNVFLTIVTLGIYRFWAKTRVRRYFWRNVNVSGEPLEYTGTGRELFIGFLIALAVLIPLGLAYQGVGLLVAGAGMAATIAANVVFYAGFLLLMQVALFRARRYRLSRTAWRGIRFGQDGSSTRFALVSGAWALLSAITLGFAEPWRRMAINRMLMNDTRFGTQKFAFNGNGKDLFIPWLPVQAINLCILAIYAWIIVDVMAVAEVLETRQPPPRPEEVMPVMMGAVDPLAMTLLPVLILAVVVVFVWFRVREFRYSAARTALGQTSFRSTLKAGRIFWLFLIYLAFAVIGFGAAAVIFVSAVSGAPAGGVSDAYLAGVAAMFLVMLLLPILKIAWLNFEILKAVCHTLDVDNLVAVDTVVQDSRKSPRFGEGLADAFDVDVGGL